jgi:2-phosphosulfolactate phosphatase
LAFTLYYSAITGLYGGQFATMSAKRQVHVHLLPQLVPEGALTGSIAVVVDVLRATTTIVHALAAGCTEVRPCLEVDEARALALQFPKGTAILGGERHGKPIPGFDLGNSPGEYTPDTCRGRTLVFTTTNGTRAIYRALGADRVLLAGLVNLNSVCEGVMRDSRPLHVICAGADGEIALEDTIVAGAIVNQLAHGREMEFALNDSALIAFYSFEFDVGLELAERLCLSKGGAGLQRLGYSEDIRAAARVNESTLVPEVRRDPTRVVLIS